MEWVEWREEGWDVPMHDLSRRKAVHRLIGGRYWSCIKPPPPPSMDSDNVQGDVPRAVVWWCAWGTIKKRGRTKKAKKLVPIAHRDDVLVVSDILTY